MLPNGHFDVVDTDVCGDLAFDSDETCDRSFKNPVILDVENDEAKQSLQHLLYRNHRKIMPFFFCVGREVTWDINAAALAVRVVCLWIAVLFSWTEGDRTRLRLRPVSG